MAGAAVFAGRRGGGGGERRVGGGPSAQGCGQGCGYGLQGICGPGERRASGADFPHVTRKKLVPREFGVGSARSTNNINMTESGVAGGAGRYTESTGGARTRDGRVAARHSLRSHRPGGDGGEADHSMRLGMCVHDDCKAAHEARQEERPSLMRWVVFFVQLAATATAGPAVATMTDAADAAAADDPWRSVARVETSPSTHSPPGAFFVVTSNVDAHFHRAGFTAGEVNCHSFACLSFTSASRLLSLPPSRPRTRFRRPGRSTFV